MAWTPQARAAAVIARKRKGPVKYKVVAKQAGPHSQFKVKAKKAARYAAAGAVAATATYTAGYATAKTGNKKKVAAARNQGYRLGSNRAATSMSKGNVPPNFKPRKKK